MKLSDRAKKRLTFAGLGVVCVVLVIAIVSQFKTEAPKDVSVQPSSTVSDAVSPGTVIPTPSADPTKAPEVSAKSIDPTAAPTPTQGADTADSTGTEQSLQSTPAKPEAPTETPAPQDETAVTNSSKPPEYKPEDTVKTEPSSPKAGDKNEKGQMWFPGFGWVDDGGANEGTKADDMYENGNKIGDMN